MRPKARALELRSRTSKASACLGVNAASTRGTSSTARRTRSRVFGRGGGGGDEVRRQARGARGGKVNGAPRARRGAGPRRGSAGARAEVGVRLSILVEQHHAVRARGKPPWLAAFGVAPRSGRRPESRSTGAPGVLAMSSRTSAFWRPKEEVGEGLGESVLPSPKARGTRKNSSGGARNPRSHVGSRWRCAR